VSPADYTAILQRDSDRADGDLVMRYMRDVRWLNECNEQIESKTFPLLSEREQERLQSQFDIAQRDLNEFNRAYPWIAEKAT
jgi:hypothetical protein